MWPGLGRATQKQWPTGHISGRALARPSPIIWYEIHFMLVLTKILNKCLSELSCDGMHYLHPICVIDKVPHLSVNLMDSDLLLPKFTPLLSPWLMGWNV